MKNTTTKKKTHHYPGDKTRWAYFMQAIEPTSEAINKAFPDYHPQWVQQSQRLSIAPESFKYLRSVLLGITIEQCAAYLRVTADTVSKWERTAVPFMAFELLRVVSESVNFKLAHPEWDGWFMSSKGQLVSPDVGCSFKPDELNLLSFQRRDLSFMRGEIKRLQSELDAATSENTNLRKMFVDNGVVDEVAAMQQRANDLMRRINTARVLSFTLVEDEPLQEKAA